MQVAAEGGLNNQSVVQQTDLRNGVRDEVLALQKIEEHKGRFALSRGIGAGGCFLQKERQNLNPLAQTTGSAKRGRFQPDVREDIVKAGQVGRAHTISAAGDMFGRARRLTRTEHFGEIVAEGGRNMLVHDGWATPNQQIHLLQVGLDWKSARSFQPAAGPLSFAGRGNC